MQHRGFSIFKYYLFHALDDDLSCSAGRDTQEKQRVMCDLLYVKCFCI